MIYLIIVKRLGRCESAYASDPEEAMFLYYSYASFSFRKIISSI